MQKHIHIVCLDVPYPMDYGGVFDLFCKLKTLHQLNIKIHLHCFEYGRGQQPELNNYCEEINYYPRKEGHKGFSHRLPYIVCSRSSGELLERLLKDDHPILLEGVHCTYLLNDERFANRKIFLRLHNIEHKYYQQLFHSEKSIGKKIYYWHESNVLKHYERKIANKIFIISVSQQDADHYKNEFHAERIEQLPVFLPFENVSSKAGTGCFCLYHGNLSVAENEEAVTWLLLKVFNDLDLPLVIAGKNPSARLQRLIAQNAHACLVSNPSEEEMQDMISKAQINILPSFNCTGIKLKLLNALFNGRHCIVNKDAVINSGLESACTIISNAQEGKEMVRDLYERPFLQETISKREKLLSSQFNNERNGQQLIKWIW
ncbi:MAG: glycosyltransferase [Bacteroidetes bacterium]|nr:glycosyltransferase [Bacteroidota bacterium]